VLRSAVALGAALALLLPGAAAADWPIYGHDLANSRDAGRAGPSALEVPSMQRAWTFTSQTGDFTGTPVVARGVLVAGNNGGWVYALDAASGRVLWSKDVGAPINGTAAIDLRAPGGAAVFVPVAKLGEPRLLALSLWSGATRWETPLTDQPGADVYGSPVYWKGSLYIGTGGPNDDNSTARGSVVALNEATGTVRWQTFTAPVGADGAGVWSTPAIDRRRGRVYVGTGNNYHDPTTDTEDSIVALDADTGAILGHFQATANDSFSFPNNFSGPDYDFGASPNLLVQPGGKRLVGEGQKSGLYWALERETMRPVWQTMVGPPGYLGGVLGSTAYDRTHIYGADTVTGKVFALALDGSLAWESPDSGGLHLSPATIARRVLYTVDPTGFLMARDPNSGAILAKLPLGGASYGGVSAYGRALYVAVGIGPAIVGSRPVAPGSIVAFGDTCKSMRRRPAGGWCCRLAPRAIGKRTRRWSAPADPPFGRCGPVREGRARALR
jgi:polyvinyl alcohol dehydrogenase (cytochrome)